MGRQWCVGVKTGISMLATGGSKASTRGDEASMTCYGTPTKGAVATLEGDGWGGDGGISQTRRYHESQRV